MKRYFLRQIEIEGFRGINNENHPLKLKIAHDKVCSIFAPNASGKSSIFDALCFSFKSEISRFKNIQNKENPGEYYINHFHSTGRSTIRVNLQADDSSETVDILIQKERSGERTVTSPNHPEPEELLKSLNHDGLMIDYDLFRSFIDNKPLERGRSFSMLIGLSKISALKQKLDALSNTKNINTDHNYDTLKTKHQAKQEEYRKTRDSIIETLGRLELAHLDLNDIPKLEYQAISVLKNISIFKDILTEKEFKHIDFEGLISVLKKTEESKLQTEFIKKDNLKREIERVLPDSIDIETEQLKELAKLVESKQNLLKSTLGKEYHTLYKAAKKIFEDLSYPKTTCPLCESTDLNFEGTPLYDFVVAKLDSFERIDQTDKDIKRLWNSFIGRARHLKIQSLLAAHAINTIAEGDFMISSEKLDQESFMSLTLKLQATDKLILEQQKQLNIDIKEISDKLPPSITDTVQKITDVRKLAEDIAHLAKVRDEGIELKNQCDHIERWKEFVSNISSQITQAETALSQVICSEIEEDTRNFFQRIINSNRVVPSLKRATNKQDLDLVLDSFFSTANLYASPLLSESYRNAFAVSVYLAALIRSKPKARFLILDDVTSSFDAGNQLSLIELLFSVISTANNPNGLQIIVLSHDGLLKKYFNTQASGLSEKWQHYELGGVAPEGRVTANLIGNDNLRSSIVESLQAGESNLGALLMRQYLELKIMEVIKKLDIPVPLDIALREDSRMISDCLKAINSHIQLTHQAKICVLEQQQFDALQNTVIPSIMSNYLSHLETNSILSINNQTLMGLVARIDEFSESFKYTDDKGDRKYYKSLTRVR